MVLVLREIPVTTMAAPAVNAVDVRACQPMKQAKEASRAASTQSGKKRNMNKLKRVATW